MEIYFIVIVLVFLFAKITQPDRSREGKKKFTFLSFGLLSLVAALRREDVGYDLVLHYAYNFDTISHLSWSEIPAYSLTGYEIGYCYFCKLMSVINPDIQSLIVGTSIVSIWSIGYFFYKKSPNVLMSTLLFIFFCTFYMYMNILRQVMAVSVILVGICVAYSDYFQDKKIIRAIVFSGFIFIASLFHNSAILCMLFVLFDFIEFKRSYIIGALVITVAMLYAYDYVFGSVISLFDNEHYEMYIGHETESKGNLNRNTIISSFLVSGAFILGYMSFIRKGIQSTVEETEGGLPLNLLMFSCFVGAICRILVFKMNIISRFSYYFLPLVFILYPLAINNLSGNKGLVTKSLYILSMVYFIWMTLLHVEVFYATVPYHFYWE